MPPEEPIVNETLADALTDEVRAERRDALSGPDSPEGRALGAAVGENVSTMRAERGLDLATLARRTGIRPELLEALEGGRAVPSLRAVWHLATGLEVPFGRLLAHTMLTATGDPDFRIQHAGRGRIIQSSTGSFRSRVLFLEGDPRAPEVYEFTLRAGATEEAEPHADDTFEHITVLRGELIVRSDGKEARLGTGDTLFFRADLPHSYENRSQEDAVAHLVMSYSRG
jgi:transcriptional regulator with XRE-family HTH domain